MNYFLLDTTLKKINSSIVAAGKEYFTLNKVLEFSYSNHNNKYVLNSLCNGYNVNAVIIDNNICDFSCECSQYKYKLICKHVVATLYKFNEELDISIKNSNFFQNNKIPNEIIEIYKKIVSIDYLFCIEFSNNSFSVIFPSKDIYESVLNNYDLLIDTINKLSSKKEELEVLKVKKILKEFNTFKSFFFIDNDIYQGVEIDKVISIIKENKFEFIKLNLWKNQINDAKVIFYNEQILELKCTSYNTIIEYIISLNITLLDFIYSNDYSYLLLDKEGEKIIYRIPYCEINNFKILKSNYISSKSKSYFDGKLNALMEVQYFDVAFDNKIRQDDKKIKLEFCYNEKNNKVLVAVKTNFENKDILYNSLIKYFKKYIDDYDQTKQLFTFKNNKEEIDLFLEKVKSINDTEFEFNIPKYFKNHKEKINLNFDVNENEIKFDLNSEIIDNDTEFGRLKKAQKNNEKFISFKGVVYLVENFAFNEIKNKFIKYNINDISYKNNIIDYKNIFALSKEIDDKKIITFLNKIESKKVELNVEKHILSFLKPYQLEGVKWMKKNLFLFGGCILADEMGLGKTLQALTLISDYLSNKKICDENILIVTPSILLKNWLIEIQKFNFNNLETIVLDGNKNKRLDDIKNNKNKNKIFITTYTQLVNDFEYLSNINFEYIILDEGQKIKNHQSLTSKKIRNIKGNKRVILSGTPIENNLLELWTIFDFILPNFLPSLSFFKKIYGTKSLDGEALDILNLQTSPFILKRAKKENISLPDKKINDIFVSMSDDELDEYKKIFDEQKIAFNKLEKNDSINILSILTKLRLFSCFNDFGNSKLYTLEKILKDILPKKSKIIIFCFFSSILEKISIYLSEQNINNLLLTGKTRNRWEIINSFNNTDTQILLCSLKTGGIGLNFTKANYVINYSPWWNESSENQAVDRVHRIGQTENVWVYNLILKNSIEMEIYNLKKKKTKLINNVINNIDYYEILNKIFNNKKEE